MHKLAQLDQHYVWHPFTQADEWEADAPPLIIDKAEGVELIDVHGNRYLDGVSSLWTNVHGHRQGVFDLREKTPNIKKIEGLGRGRCLCHLSKSRHIKNTERN